MTKGSRLKKLDIFVVAIVFIIGIAGFVGLKIFSAADGSGAAAKILYENEEIETVDLHTNRDIVFERDGRYNLIRVKDGEIQIAESNCANQNCVHSGSKRYAGELIVCLPNRLVIEIEKGEEREVDAVAG